jgi:hypothetical protein
VAEKAADAYRVHLGLSFDELDGPTGGLQERLHASDSPCDWRSAA